MGKTMTIAKKLSTLIVFLPLISALTIHTMEIQPTIAEQPTFSDYIIYIGDILLGNIQLQPTESSPLQQLPPEIQGKIINFILLNNRANSVTTCGQIINNLARVNKELNELINDPRFCLQLIKHIAQRFNCSDETAAKALQTQAAKQRLAIQQEFERIFCEELFNEQIFNYFYAHHKNNIDLNFTYKFYGGDTDFKYTPLLFVSKTMHNSGKKRMSWLLNTGLVNVNCADTYGMTPLMNCATGTSDDLLLLCNAPGININQKNKRGQTALLLLCTHADDFRFTPNNIQILLNAGADPEIADNHGYSPLQIVQDYENEEAIELIKNAIAKKHNKK